MFISRKALIGAFVLLLCFGALVYRTKPYDNLLNNLTEKENIVIEISPDPESSATTHDTSEDTEDANPANQPSDTELQEVNHIEPLEYKPAEPPVHNPTEPPQINPTDPPHINPTDPPDSGDENVTPTIDQSASSQQPATTKEPRGWQEPAPLPESAKKIGDSWDHVKDTKDIMNFVHTQCEKYHQRTAKPGQVKKPRMIIIPKNWREHMILYSSNPKTGSTSFKRFLTRIQGDRRPYEEITGVHVMRKYGNIEEAWKLAYSKSENPSLVTLSDMVKPFYKVGFMRNPLTRLISGFRDKILRRTEDGIKGDMRNIDPYLTAESSDADKFAAFAEGVIKGTIKNFHFTPQAQKMKICDFPYDIIAQTETTSQQMREIQEHTNTTQYDFPGSRSDNGFDSVATVHLAHEFYDKVKPDIMDKIYQYYKWDFVLMGYTKLSNPNFPYLDFEQDFEKEFGPLN